MYLKANQIQERQYEYHKHNKNSDKIVIFIHGILEGSMQFRNLAKIAYEEGYSTLVLLLPGHGKGGKEFSSTSMQEWIEYVNCSIRDMKARYNEIILVGHSMGTLLAIEYAAHYKNKISALILLACPIKLWINPKVIVGGIKIAIDHINQNERYVVAECRAMGVKRTKLHGCVKWLPRYLELLILIRHSKKQIQFINAPMYIIQSKNDEFISMSTCNYLTKRYTNINLYTLERSSHFCYFKKDLMFLETIIRCILKNKTN